MNIIDQQIDLLQQSMAKINEAKTLFSTATSKRPGIVTQMVDLIDEIDYEIELLKDKLMEHK